MQSEVPSETFIWRVLAQRFQSEPVLLKSEVWRLSGLRQEYEGRTDRDLGRERELQCQILTVGDGA